MWNIILERWICLDEAESLGVKIARTGGKFRLKEEKDSLDLDNPEDDIVGSPF
jgi:hypothetical protein